MDKEERIHYLLQQYANEAATEEEVKELSGILLNKGEDKLVQKALEKFPISAPAFEYEPAIVDKIVDEILSPSQAPVIPMRKSFRMNWAAAAIIFLMIGGLGYWLLKGEKKEYDLVVQTPSKNVDIKPGGDRAILTLANGQQIVLDSASDGNLTEQGGVKVIKIGGQLAYDVTVPSTQVFYNTISTPRGGQYQLVLGDGSKVWLNAASSLRFPSAFIGKERTVELTGEGYFEIAHNPEMPFIVKVKEMNVAVLGTHFNINSYEDESSVKTTLLEGRVKVQEKEKQLYLNPGQQAVLNPNDGGLKVVYSVDVEEVVAWKNGQFMFNSADIAAVMRQVSRWYDVEVVFKGNLNETVSGELPRSENVSQLLKLLELTGKLNFEIDGKRIIVKPKQ